MNPERPAAPPQYSQDGRWWWDGQRWTPTIEMQARLRAHQQRWSTVNWVLVGLGAAAVGVFVMWVLASLAGATP